MHACIEIIEDFAMQSVACKNEWKLYLWVTQLLSDTGGLLHAMESLLLGENLNQAAQFFNKLKEQDAGYILNRVAVDLDKQYGITGWV